jgi:hypothetical protein
MGVCHLGILLSSHVAFSLIDNRRLIPDKVHPTVQKYHPWQTTLCQPAGWAFLVESA